MYFSININVYFRLPQIYEEFRHSIQNADANKDLKWWSNNHGVGMAMNWPVFEVRNLDYIQFKIIRYLYQIISSSLLLLV